MGQVSWFRFADGEEEDQKAPPPPLNLPTLSAGDGGGQGLSAVWGRGWDSDSPTTAASSPGQMTS